MTDRELRIARLVCTPKELDACILAVAGRTQREISMALGVSRRAVRDRLHQARLKIALHLERKDAA